MRYGGDAGENDCRRRALGLVNAFESYYTRRKQVSFVELPDRVERPLPEVECRQAAGFQETGQDQVYAQTGGNSSGSRKGAGHVLLNRSGSPVCCAAREQDVECKKRRLHDPPQARAQMMPLLCVLSNPRQCAHCGSYVYLSDGIGEAGRAACMFPQDVSGGSIDTVRGRDFERAMNALNEGALHAGGSR